MGVVVAVGSWVGGIAAGVKVGVVVAGGGGSAEFPPLSRHPTTNTNTSATNFQN